MTHHNTKVQKPECGKASSYANIAHTMQYSTTMRFTYAALLTYRYKIALHFAHIDTRQQRDRSKCAAHTVLTM